MGSHAGYQCAFGILDDRNSKVTDVGVVWGFLEDLPSNSIGFSVFAPNSVDLLFASGNGGVRIPTVVGASVNFLIFRT